MVYLESKESQDFRRRILTHASHEVDSWYIANSKEQIIEEAYEISSPTTEEIPQNVCFILTDHGSRTIARADMGESL